MEFQNKGICRFCLKTFSGPSMGRHLLACKTKQQKDLDKINNLKEIYHIKISAYEPFWLHIEMDSNATLFDLDDFLRDIWLECCGHLSEFKINGARYIGYEEEDGIWQTESKSMDIKLNQVLNVKDKFEYSYDFGSTTYVQGHILHAREGILDGKIRILARNNPPLFQCENCQNIATEICVQCEEAYCDKCISVHDCEEDFFLPVVNSPRMGVCGYVGEYDFDKFDLTA